MKCLVMHWILGWRGRGPFIIVSFDSSWVKWRDTAPRVYAVSSSKADSDVPERDRNWWPSGDRRFLLWNNDDSACLVPSERQPNSDHSSSEGSGCCHRSREHIVHHSAYHDTRHTSDHPEHKASLPPIIEQETGSRYRVLYTHRVIISKFQQKNVLHGGVILVPQVTPTICNIHKPALSRAHASKRVEVCCTFTS